MKKTPVSQNYVVLEPAVFGGSLSGCFYRFCLLRFPQLLAYAPPILLGALLGLFSFIKPGAPLSASLSWKFLRAVPNLPKAAAAFARRKRRFSLPAGCDVLVSHGPSILLSLWFGGQVRVLANPYDLAAGRFLAFSTVKALLNGEKTPPTSLTAGFGRLPFGHRRIYAAFGRTFPSLWKALAYGAARAALRLLLLIFFGALLGLLSLYYAAELFGGGMFPSYFANLQLVFLNLLPPMILLLVFYALFNRLWLAFAGGFFFTLIPTWISYFKLMYRNEPFYFEEMTLIREAQNMTGAYAIRPTTGIWLFILAGVLLTALFFFIKPRPKRFAVSLPLFLAAVALGTGLYFGLYQSEALYESTKNESLINRWSQTEQFVSRGFVYPFLYSAKDVLGSARPDDYDPAATAIFESAYQTADIPAKQKVNILFVMLESFNDFSRYSQIPFRKNPYTLWNELAEEGVSGRLAVNVFGGGTVDTERRVMTGYTRLPTFRTETNSFVRYFASQGYQTFGGHPSFNWFYDRDSINQNLGFADFTFADGRQPALEEGRKDASFLPKVLAQFEERKSAGPCFGFFVTYQGHGPYDASKTYETPFLEQGAIPNADYNQMETYFQSAADTCLQLSQLANALRLEEEPVVLVLFGDHNPFLGKDGFDHLQINMDTATEEGFYNYYSTPYLIWGNDAAKEALQNDLTGQGPTVSPEFLIPTLFKTLSWQGNTWIQAEINLADRLPIIHKTGRFLENGVVTGTPLAENLAFYRKFASFQYDWQTKTP